jgi:hypothetical protein
MPSCRVRSASAAGQDCVAGRNDGRLAHGFGESIRAPAAAYLASAVAISLGKTSLSFPSCHWLIPADA